MVDPRPSKRKQLDNPKRKVTTGHRCRAQTKEQLWFQSSSFTPPSAIPQPSKQFSPRRMGVHLMSSLPSHIPWCSSSDFTLQVPSPPTYRASRSESINQRRHHGQDELQKRRLQKESDVETPPSHVWYGLGFCPWKTMLWNPIPPTGEVVPMSVTIAEAFSQDVPEHNVRSRPWVIACCLRLRRCADILHKTF
jgi:hypothetical protein